MKSITPQIMWKNITRRAWCACRKVTAIGGVFVLMFQTVNAGPILMNDVVQRVNNLQGLVDLRVRSLSQQQDTKVSGSKTVDSTGQTGITTDSLLSTVNVDTPKIGVDAAEDAIIEGTVCDCGEFILPAAGFPKWPLLFLAAIPLIFLKNSDCQDCNPIPIPTPTCLNCSPTPTCLNCDTVPSPTPTPTIEIRKVEEVPEPASLILFGTGLLAFAGGLRRRYARKKSDESTETGEDGK